MKVARRVAVTAPEAPSEPLGLAEAATTEDMFRLVVKAIDEGRVDTARGRLLLEAVKVRLPVVEVADFRRKLEAAEAQAREAARLAAGRGLPVRASKAVVEVAAVADGEGSSSDS